MHACVMMSDTVHTGNVANAGRFTNGFPKRLVARIYRPGDDMYDTTRLIPEMSFTCNSTIVGFTVAGRQRRDRHDDPIIQIWRENSSQSDVYYKTSADIVINETVCAEISEVFQRSKDNDKVWQCNLTEVSVQPGDILGLKLPPKEENSFRLAFARVSRGPTNYVFEQPDELPYPDVVVLGNAHDSTNQLLPQIVFQVATESGMYLGCLVAI